MVESAGGSVCAWMEGDWAEFKTEYASSVGLGPAYVYAVAAEAPCETVYIASRTGMTTGLLGS